jgi:hypothetical protein
MVSSSMFLSASFDDSEVLTTLLRVNLQGLQASAHKIENIISNPGVSTLPVKKSLGDTSKGGALARSAEVEEPCYDDLISPINSVVLPGGKKIKELATW